MKKRLGFVSNSSSSSIIIKRDFISPYIRYQIENHSELGEKMGIPHSVEWAWSIEDMDNGDMRVYHTTMDNFDMGEFLTQIGLPNSAFEYE